MKFFFTKSLFAFLLLMGAFSKITVAQTKFYLNLNTTAPLSPAFNPGWNVTTGATRYIMSPVKDGSASASKSTNITVVSTGKCLFDQFISAPLATQTITGPLNLTGQIRYQLSSLTSASGTGFVYVRLINADGSIASELGNTTTSALAAALTNRTVTSVNVGTVSITSGQRLCIEVGCSYNVSAAVTRTYSASRGSASGTDLAVDNSTTTANNPWFQFSQTILFQPPANDDCANAKLIVSDSTCVAGTSSLTGETLTDATDQGYTIASSCFSSTNTPDVWYKFVARSKNPTITISNQGSGWGGIGNVKVQLLSGSCGALTEVACASGATLTPAITNPLVQGNTYYIRIHRNAAGIVPANYTFDICVTNTQTKGGRMSEIFSRTVLSPAGVLNYPWEITYGPDNNLWITEAQGYRIQKMDPNTGVKTTVLDLSSGSTFLPAPSDSLNAQSMGSWSPWPQGGFAGMALHPNFLDGTGNTDFVYVAYVHRFLGGSSPAGLIYRNKLVRFTYNTATGKLGSPVVICDTLPGSKDHNSQRLLIAPVVKGGTNYLFYGSGDMGSGQFENRDRPQRAQIPGSYEGKILRFNLVPDIPAGTSPWIPDDNPYSPNSAVYSIGIRNNQGFAYDTALNILYGSSHGPYSDDEINIIEPYRNYGHPLVIGYAEGNYNGTTSPSTNTSISAGAPFTDNSGNSTCPPVGNELNNIATINAAGNGLFKRPLFSAYPTPAATIANTWKVNTGNANWYSEAWSGLDLYTNTIIPGWKKSLVAAGLKWGRLIRLPLGATGTTTLPSNLDSLNTSDTITYFQSTNRYRDLAFAPNGKDIFLVMDNSSATSGPGVGNPTTPACPGCVIKYSFLGYADAGGFSTIPKSVNVTDGPTNTCIPGTTITIDGSNNYLWVPITGPDGNILAELNCMGQSLGVVTSSFYKNGTGSIRVAGSIHYLDRNITITPTVTSFATPVKVRLYISKAELDALIADGSSGVASISNLKILKNSDPCGSAITNATTLFTPSNTVLTDLQQGPNGYVLQTAVPGFSSFYFAANNVVLPVDQLTFTGTLQNDNTSLLKWQTDHEINTSNFAVQRSIDGINFSTIGTVTAHGNTSTISNYDFTDIDAADQQSAILYYRLKVNDVNGVFKYSNTISITMPLTKGSITVSPNPAVNDMKATVVSPVTGNATWKIVDNTGRTIMYGTTLLKKGSNEIPVNITRLAAGSYYMNISGTDITLKTKFQKL
ncbi:PQQ-dependent sugar dehydrogenase [Ferruginibacter sp. SUN106]|uniref:PQQ-dependent sugar dehydrogenase n=1 Tax=Ferruginibacter sp. SUN106 TaxID=2978348 RepID=UPI003D36EA08